jgi:hypothetical protein
MGVREVLGAVIDSLPPPGDWLDRVARLSGSEEVAEEIKEKRKEEDPDALRGLIIDT